MKAYIIDVIIGNIIGFVAGTALTWTSPVIAALEDSETTPFEAPLTPDEVAWISSMLPLGAIVGPPVYGILADLIGRKPTMLICGVPFLVAFVIFAFVPIPWTFYIARFLCGMSVGGVFTVLPVYVGEIAEDSNRGALGTSFNCFICFGFFFSHAVGSYTSFILFNVILIVFPAIFLVLFALIAWESPHYYVNKNKTDKAKESLAKIRKDEAAVNEELARIEEAIKESRSGSVLDIFRNKGNRKAFIICVCLLAFQQLSGINAVLFYVESIFRHAGTSLEEKVCSIIVGSVQFLTSFTTPLVVDRLGRKILLIASAAGIIVSEVPLGIYCFLYDGGHEVEDYGFVPVLCLVLYIITFNIGLAIIPWSLLGELFPISVKSKCSALATSITWFIGFFIAKYFPEMTATIGLGPSFWIFSGFCALCIPFVLFYVVETKGKTFQEIHEILQN